jgi:Flp pilus assembly pilin Flp
MEVFVTSGSFGTGYSFGAPRPGYCSTAPSMMSFSKKSLTTERGQGLVEYSLIVLLVVLVFWLAVQGTGMGAALENTWNTIEACAGSPFSCGSGS